jgi:hypothetical protein
VPATVALAPRRQALAGRRRPLGSLCPRDGHGGNLGLKSRDATDYQVSILEVAGSAATFEKIIAML